MKTLRERFISLYFCRGMTRKRLFRLMQYDSNLTAIYTLAPTEISRYLNFSSYQSTLFYQDLHDKQRFEKIKNAEKTTSIITILDPIYPALLKNIVDPPLILFALGNKALLNHEPSLSVIGTRKPSDEAFQKMEIVLPPLIKNNWLLVSGMATGVDSYAHKLALAHNGRTIAVLGSGFKNIYPKQNIELFQEIRRKGLVLSEYSPATPPRKYHFPERNRIISGLSFGTLVVEAKERSGTMITVDQALDQGREVYALPGSLLASQTRGCHQMIQDGAKLVMEADDINDDWLRMGKHMHP
ncbi:DNA-processing protein DprA [Virgibacillus sp. W0430]|uniref:DNA-processing protein DprA n=1 Tax=Virgibacillus sp. W0430 TaxID=3391580 RepID=UPI003F4898CD